MSYLVNQSASVFPFWSCERINRQIVQPCTRVPLSVDARGTQVRRGFRERSGPVWKISAHSRTLQKLSLNAFGPSNDLKLAPQFRIIFTPTDGKYSKQAVLGYTVPVHVDPPGGFDSSIKHTIPLYTTQGYSAALFGYSEWSYSAYRNRFETSTPVYEQRHSPMGTFGSTKSEEIRMSADLFQNRNSAVQLDKLRVPLWHRKPNI